jgi:hypothetical protein
MCLTMRNRRWRMEIESTAATAWKALTSICKL